MYLTLVLAATQAFLADSVNPPALSPENTFRERGRRC
jgi:hypothetical protein